VFEAIHSDKKLINSKGRFFDWLEDNGIDEEKAAAIYDSFSVNAKIKRDAIIAQEYGISSTPQIAVAGKYVLTPGQSASQSDMMRVVSLLIERERSAIKKEE
jgi:thiol:disulfide interchange protein DsbA